jgi:hypothetical protein
MKTEGLGFYKEQMRQMRVQRDAHDEIVLGLREEISRLNGLLDAKPKQRKITDKPVKK